MTQALDPATTPTDHVHPVTMVQQAIWFEQQLAPDSIRYNITTGVRVRAEGDAETFRRALEHIVASTPSLRSTFRSVDGIPVQVVSDEVDIDLTITDIADASDAEVDALLREQHLRHFDLETGPLVRFQLLRRSPTDHIVTFGVHHVIADLWSNALLGYLLASTYRELVTTSDLSEIVERSTYEEHSRREAELLAGDKAAASVEFWRPLFEGWSPQPLPSDRPISRLNEGIGSTVEIDLPEHVVTRLRSWAQEQGVSIRSVILGAYHSLLHRITDADQVMVGELKANRSARMATTIGCCLNQVPRAASFAPSTTLEDVVTAVDEATRASRSHEAVPFTSLLHQLRPGHGDAPFFAATFAWQKTSRLVDERLASSLAIGEQDSSSELSGMTVEPVAMPVRSAPDPLTLLAVAADEDIRLSFEFQVESFDRTTVESFGRQLRAVLQTIATQPDRSVCDVDLVDPAEREAQDAAWREAKHPLDTGETAVDLIRRSVRDTPDRVAVTDATTSLTYGELGTRSSELAERLRSAGCQRGDLVGICLDRSVEVVVAMVAVWKCSAGYVPMDPEYPAPRLSAMLADASITRVISSQRIWSSVATAIDTDEPRSSASIEMIDATDGNPVATDRDVELERDGSDTAYVIFTSGSTGRPKGVVVDQTNVVNFVRAMARRPGIEPDDTILATTTLSFDISLLELIAPLTVGATVRVATRDDVLDPGRLATELEHATIAQATPTLWKVIIESGWRGRRDLTVLCGGEPMTRQLADDLLERCGTLWNMYGPTETTVWSSVEEMKPGNGPVSIGAPIDNTALYVLDDHGAPVSPGQSGELWIGGAGVARGYIGRPDLTAERFLPDPFLADTTHMYRTGDLVRRNADRSIVFIGRLDGQVKLRGHRIELGEVEAVLSAHPNIAEAVTQVHEFGTDDSRLVAYYRLAAHASPTADERTLELRSHVAERLPAYMVPGMFVPVTEFPQTLNGKVDRTALAPPSSTVDEAASPAPAPEDAHTVQNIVSIFRNVLGDDTIAADDDFFAAGGHSIHATRIVSRIRRDLGVEVPLRSVFDQPTARALAAACQSAPQALTGERSAYGTPDSAAEVHDQDFPLSSSQERMWYAEVISGGSAAYNLAAQLRLTGTLDLDEITAAFSKVVSRHSSLRTTFNSGVDGPTARVHPSSPVELDVVDHLDRDSLAERLAAAVADNERRATETFDLAAEPLYRLTAHRLGPDDVVIGLVIHHIICDQWSFGVLLQEMTALLLAERKGVPIELEPPPRSENYALAQRADLTTPDVRRQLNYWRSQLDGLQPVGLPTERRSHATVPESGRSATLDLPEDLLAAIRRTADEHASSEFMVELAALQLFVHRTTGAGDIGIGVPIANRHWAGSESLVSTLVNTLVIRTQFAPISTFSELLADIRDTTLDAHANQDIPFEQLVAELPSAQRRDAMPFFGVFFNVQNAPIELPELDDLAIEVMPLNRRAAQFEFALTIDAELTNTLTVEYSADLFEDDQIRSWLHEYRTILEEITSLDGDAYLVKDRRDGSDRRAVPDRRTSAPSTQRTDALAAVVLPDDERTGDSTPLPGRETEIAEVWARVLGLPSIGRHDDFFDLGGHSILAVRILAEIEEFSEHRPPMSLLFRAPTVATLTAALETDRWAPAATSLVSLTQGSGSQNFFYVSPFLISSLSFHELAQRSGPEISFYALQPQGLETDDAIHTSVEEMAAHYVSEMRAVQPIGPYLIGGHCAGGWVAFEMARQLEAAGERTDRIVIVDVEPPGIQAPQRQLLRFIASRLVLYGGGGRIFHALKWQLSIASQRLHTKRVARSQSRRGELVRDVHIEAHRKYTGGKISGDVDLIRSEEWHRLPDKKWHLEWERLIDGRLRVSVIPGAHARLLDGEGVVRLAETLRSILGQR